MSLNFNQIEIIEDIVKPIEAFENVNENKNIEKINNITENLVNENKNIEKINNITENLDNEEDNDCGICGSALLEDVVKLKCNHMFHFECITLSYKFSHAKLCPYCRKPSNIPTSKNNIKPIGTCEGILKTGKRKGEKCGCTIFKNPLSLKLCKRHFNVEQKKNDNIINQTK